MYITYGFMNQHESAQILMNIIYANLLKIVHESHCAMAYYIQPMRMFPDRPNGGHLNQCLLSGQ